MNFSLGGIKDEEHQEVIELNNSAPGNSRIVNLARKSSQEDF